MGILGRKQLHPCNPTKQAYNIALSFKIYSLAMQNLTFNELPQAVTQLYGKLENIERLLLENSNQHQPETDELLTVQDAAKLLSLSVPTIYTLISKGDLPVMKRSKRCYFSKQDLINYLKQGRRKTNLEIAKETEAFLLKKKGGKVS